MAKVILSDGLESISGKVGNMVFRTYKNGTVRVYKARERSQSSHHPTAEELARRRRFALTNQVTAMVQSRYEWINEAARDRKKIWHKVQYYYDKLLAGNPGMEDKELLRMILQQFQVFVGIMLVLCLE